ncbi:efflux RND transporter permease subunit [Marinihelvus fidelis]|uniref:Efflux RND transporter permease subunit n=1 Tax=Marinihelvus fidelis TaxID=2613842 RepID=A0A5N0TDF9_9GAMM|nr:efflux RND transporter permease subunit [Marinihelvus fidelis]KAA9132728.1 efflux RND transporter permease subunit [Marinihelvus fidelis]
MLARTLENPRLIALFSALLIVAGLAALAALPTTEDPRVLNRVATVLTAYPGATPERVEALVSEPIENALRSMPAIDTIDSSSQAGMSVMRVQLKDTITDAASEWSEARDKLADVAPSLPDGALAPRLDDDRGYAFTRILALRWQGDGQPDMAILGRYADELARRLRTVSGMDLVQRFGAPDEIFLVTIDSAAAARAGLSVNQVAAAIRGRDAKVAAGQLRGDGRDWQVEVSGEMDSIAALEATVLREADDGRSLRLHDIARVERAPDTPADELARVSGRPAVVVAARMLPDVRIGTWSDALDAELARFTATLPANLAIDTLFDQARYTRDRMGGLAGNLLLGFVVILSVLFLTLGWRAALVVAVALPLTAAFTLACLRFYGLPIHQMTVTGLVVALGIMVDNAIVMTDTIQRLMRDGLGRLQATTRAIRHLWLPLAGSTLTTILAFAPIALMPGPAGEFVGGIAMSVIFALLGSWLISHTLIAGLACRYLDPAHGGEGLALPALGRNFRQLLGWSLRHPRASIALAASLPIAGYLAATQMTEQFFPPSDRDMFTIEVHLDPATGIDATEAITAAMTADILAQSGIASAHWFIGVSSPSFYYNMMQRFDNRPNFAQAMVTAEDRQAADRAIPALQRVLDDRYPRAQVLVRTLEQGPPFSAPVEIRVYGPRLDTLAAVGDDIRRLALETDDVIHARATLVRGRPQAQLLIDENRVRRAGIDPVTLAGELQAQLDGVTAGSILESTEDVPVRLRVDRDHRQDADALYRLHVAGTGNQAVNVGSLGTLDIRPVADVISRRQGQRVNTIEVYLRAGILPAQVQARLQDRLRQAGPELPPGYRVEFGGESAERNAAVGNLLANVGLILALLVTTIVLSFNSFRMSSIILGVAVLAPGLGLLCVWAAGYAFGFVVIVGLMGLVGLAINAAIVIIAELRSDPDAARGDLQATIDGVMKCTRHIGSTTLTTLGGFMPLILSGGGFWPPFAIAIAGGTVLTSLLSFLLVPAAFRAFARRRPLDAPRPAARSAA